MSGTKMIVDEDRRGKKGFPRHAELMGLEPPKKTVPVNGGVPEANHPGLDTIEVFRREIQSLIDTKAQERDYDSGATLASYVSSTIPQWASEAQAFVAWRDAVWIHALTELDKVQSGARSQPSVKEFLAELPTMDWPE